MAEYIERTEELILAVNAGARAIENTKRYHGSSYCLNVFSNDHKEIPYLKAAEVLRGFDEIPSADVAPVRHGRWIDTGAENEAGNIYFCSVCNKLYNPNKKDVAMKRAKEKPDYCPNCGAKMDGTERC